MIELKTLRIKGFRAYTEEKEFIFDNHVVLLFGENHRGKSSTLNAIEWCLFGNECIGKDTGIRERIEWEIPNRNMRPYEALVEVNLKDKTTEGKITVARKWVSARKDELSVTLPDGKSLRGNEAKEKLTQVLGLSFRDFLTTVYQHQEAIRDVLVQEPKERNEAIDRLLGLSNYRNIIRGIESAKLGIKQRKMVDEFDNFVSSIDTILRSRENDLRDKRKKAVEKGLKETQLDEKGALEIAGKVKGQLHKFSSEVGLTLADLQVPAQRIDLHEFQKTTGGEIKRFRSEMPDVRKQQDLFEERTKTTALKEQYEQKESDWKTAKNKFEAMKKETSKLKVEVEEIENKISEKEKELRTADAKGAVITEAIDYLRLEGVDKNICPVCETEKPGLFEHLEKEWTEKYEKALGVIESQLDTFKKRKDEINIWFGEYKRAKRDYEDAYKGIEQIKKRIGGALGQGISIEDDLGVILSNELKEVNKRLEELGKAVKYKQATLDQIVSELEKINLIMDILDLEEKKRIVEQIQQSSEYQQMEDLKDEMAILVDDIEKIKEAIREASYKESEQKVTAAGNVIDNYFHRIANNPSIRKIEFSVKVDSRTGFNSYMFKDQGGKDLTPILSQGDLNAMALSIFLGMGCSRGTNQTFGFVMLDDPSQSLGSEHKENLIRILNEVSCERMVILSSMDKELQNLSLSKMTRAKTKYVFYDWTTKQGPEVKKE